MDFKKIKKLFQNPYKRDLEEAREREKLGRGIIDAQRKRIYDLEVRVRDLEARVCGLTCWRDPEVELPDKSKEDWVLLRVQYPDGFIGIPQIGELRDDGLWHSICHDDLRLGESFEEIYDCKVIGWRPIP